MMTVALDFSNRALRRSSQQDLAIEFPSNKPSVFPVHRFQDCLLTLLRGESNLLPGIPSGIKRKQPPHGRSEKTPKLGCRPRLRGLPRTETQSRAGQQ
jgi:hypothetical protein